MQGATSSIYKFLVINILNRIICTVDEALANVTTLQDQQVLHMVMYAWPNVLSRCGQHIEQAHLDRSECDNLHYCIKRVTDIAIARSNSTKS